MLITTVFCSCLTNLSGFLSRIKNNICINYRVNIKVLKLRISICINYHYSICMVKQYCIIVSKMFPTYLVKLPMMTCKTHTIRELCTPLLWEGGNHISVLYKKWSRVYKENLLRILKSMVQKLASLTSFFGSFAKCKIID